MWRRSARFLALPVGQGDAFFLKSPDGSVLVDGGRSVEGFRELFERVTGQREVDVVLCTHNDADHANGVLGFLRSGLGCREVWLPGR
jgi:beta-lactamase superfamily II metal-dependent hydrolase